MKKFIIAFISIIVIGIIVFLCILAFGEEKMSEYEGQTEIYKDGLGLHVYRDEDQYTVLVANNEYVGLKAVFSPDRALLHSKGFEPLEDEDFTKYIGQTYADVETVLGEYHYNRGSGMFYPSYITQDGYLVVFCLEKEKRICAVIYVDLFTGQEEQKKTRDGSVSSVD